jgi:uncharacterized protein YkwD
MMHTRRAFLSVVLGSCWLPALPRFEAAAVAAASTDGVPQDRERLVEEHVAWLTNEWRRAEGLAVLRWSGPLAEVARRHSADMMTRKYFKHVSPDRKHPADRLARAGLAYDWWAENLYSLTRGPSEPRSAADRVFRGWMRSRSHRRAILDRRCEIVGIGACWRQQRLLVTELFGS